MHTQYQDNARLGWFYMICYWGISALLFRSYFAKLTQITIPFSCSNATAIHVTAFVVTIECQRRFNHRFDRYGRRSDPIVCLIFAMANGIFETFCFLGVYDFGRQYYESRTTAIAVGWALYYLYTALIHAFFWLPMVFPKHTKATAPPFHTHGLVLLTIISVAWFTVYELYGNVGFVCLLHAIVDGWGAWNIGLPGPFSIIIRQKRM